MLFDERPKDNLRDLYDVKSELKLITSAAGRGSPLVVILGLRRTGKTSLLLTALKQLRDPSIVLDLRTLAGRPYATRRDLVQELERAFNTLYNVRQNLDKRIFNWLKRVKGISVSASGLGLSWGGKDPVDLAVLFDELNMWASKEGQRVVVAFDEAQELRKVAGVDMAKLLAHVYDYCRSLSIVLTGSAVGLLYDFLGDQDPKAPMYGRHRTEVHLKRLSGEKARDFLLRGFGQTKLQADRVIVDRAIKELDGVIGWLTLFGATCIKTGLSEEAIDQTLEAAKALAREEFENFLKGREVARRRYETILQHLARGPSPWSGIKGATEAVEGRTINDRNITALATNLVKAGFVERRDKVYTLADQMLAKSFV